MGKLESFDGTNWQTIKNSLSIELKGDVTGIYNNTNGYIDTTITKNLKNLDGVWRLDFLGIGIYTTRIYGSFEYNFNATSSVGSTISHIYKGNSSLEDMFFNIIRTVGEIPYFEFKYGNTSLFTINTTSIDINSKKLINVSNGINNTDGINLGQLNQATFKLPKQSCQCATTNNLANISGVISYTYSNGNSGIGATISLNMQSNYQIVIDNYVPRINDRILVKDQPLSKHNGIYILTTLPSASTVILTRAIDYDYIGKISQNDFIDIIFGNTNGKTRFNQTELDNITVGVSSIIFSKVNPKDCLLGINNLSDLTNITTARFNLNVYTLANPSSSGLTLSLNTTTMTATFGLNAELNALSNFSNTGLITRTGSNTYVGRTLIAGTGISITDGNGVNGNPTISLGTVPISSLSGYPTSSSVYLRGDGTWSIPLNSGGTVTSIGITGGTGLTISNSPITSSGNISINLSTQLQNLSSLITTGIITRTGTNTFTTRSLSVGTGLTISNVDGISGNPTINLGSQLLELANLSTTGIIARTGTNIFTSRTITAGGSGLTVSNGDGVLGNPTTILSTQLQNIHNLNSLGFISLTTTGIGTSNFVNRTLTSGFGIVITNYDGVSGNPIIGINKSSIPLNDLDISGDIDTHGYDIRGLPLTPEISTSATSRNYVLKKTDTFQTLAYSRALVWDTKLGNIAFLTLTGNCAIKNIFWDSDGIANFILYVKQDTVGNRSLGIYNIYKNTSTYTDMDISTGASQVDCLIFNKSGETGKLYLINHIKNLVLVPGPTYKYVSTASTYSILIPPSDSFKCRIKLLAAGGGGGAYALNQGSSGAGGFTIYEFDTANYIGQWLYFKIGQGGVGGTLGSYAGTGGYPNGGRGISGDTYPGGGGGRTEVRIGSSSGTLLAVAGGGGGGSGYSTNGLGGGGGNTGQDGVYTGSGGKQNAGGLSNPNPGVELITQAGYLVGAGPSINITSSNYDCGGGGDGYYGGGCSGGDGRTSGGGSGYVNNTFTGYIIGTTYVANGVNIPSIASSDSDFSGGYGVGRAGVASGTALTGGNGKVVIEFI